MAAQLKTNGIILQTRTMEDEDRLLTVLTEKEGVLTAYGRGARRFKTKMASATEVLTYSELVLFRNKDQYILDNASTLHIFFGLRGDIFKLALGCYLGQLTAELAPRGEFSGEYMRLLLNTLSFLESGKRPASQLKPLYELRLLAMAGYMPDLVGCRECGCFESPLMFFDPLDGNLICGQCAGEEASRDRVIPVPGSVLAAMRHIIYSEMEKLFQFQLPSEDLERLRQVVETYLLMQTDRSYTSLDYYKSLLLP